MRFRIRSTEDFYAGLMFIGFGILAMIVARDYPMGSAMRMGPGYFPTYIGALLVVVGALVSAQSLRVRGEGIGRWAWRPLIGLCLAFLAFGLVMDHFALGFVPALLALIVLSSLSGRESRLWEVAMLSAVLIAGAAGLFIYLLELPYPLFWWR
ncbi:MAG: tripartite tricarboxylate transporter TctB family protein [Betaproteobacteria bacterium]|nr:tripartite tricarboxylate transporter TctB family protein [Betaproteobacteria bacterium]